MPVSSLEKQAYYLGLDVGKVNDPSALCVLERRLKFQPGPHSPAHPDYGATRLRYSVRHLERLPLGTSYPAVADRVAAIADKLPLQEIVVDITGVGRPVLDMLREKVLGVQLTGVHFTGGEKATSPDNRVWNVPKKDLVSGLVVMFQSKELLIAEGLPDAPVLVKELVNFRQFLSATGYASFGNDGKEAQHDDYVSACALAAWRAYRRAPRGLGERCTLPLW